ncbi:hypothetical protein B0H14DRAFT_712061 [Mycena olivaceomarginata]|nr:hypothetical protein B0H14DRAFT_712061 [Mycena olivaceomarginata]
MRKDAFPAVLSMLVNLTDISVECEVLMDWNSFPPLVKEALHVTVALPSLVSVQLQHLSFDQSGDLTSFLQSCKHVDDLVLSGIAVRDIGGNAGLDPRLGLCSLTLGPSHLPLIHSVMSAFDMQSLWYLHVTVPIPELEAEIQHLLDGTENLEHFYVCLDHHHNTSNIDLQSLTHLRTLEIALLFDFSTAPDGFDPVGWTGNIIATSCNPSPIQHVILNVRVDERDLSYLSRLKELERFLVAPEMSSAAQVDCQPPQLRCGFQRSRV